MTKHEVTKQANPTGTAKVSVWTVTKGLDARVRTVSAFNRGATDRQLIVYEENVEKDRIPLAVGEHVVITDKIYVFRPGKAINAALDAGGDVVVTMTIEELEQAR